MMDLAAQRILSMQHSAANAGKTEQSRLRELLPSAGAGMASSGMALLGV